MTLFSSGMERQMPLLLRRKGRMHGIREDMIVKEKEVRLRQGDKILFYINVLTEAMSPSGFFLEERLSRVIGLHRRNPVKKMVEKIYPDLMAFRGSEKFEDDVCITGMEFAWRSDYV
jgi:serine phosphatase RsbU (regulator of sigma subunit)